MKAAERAVARELRAAEGLSIKTIAARLGVSVSSVSRWVADVPLTARQRAALEAADPVAARRWTGTLRNAERCREERRRAQEQGRALVGAAPQLHQIGCMLFWAEGSKSRNRVVFTNADVEMVRVFVRFLRECYAVDDSRIRLTCNCFLGNGLSLEEIERWWLNELQLPTSSLLPSVVNRPSSASQGKRRTLPYGTARVVVDSTAIVQSIYGAIQEYAGIERPEWLG